MLTAFSRALWNPARPSTEPAVDHGRRKGCTVHHTAHGPCLLAGREAVLKTMWALRGARPDLFPGREPDCPYNFVMCWVDVGLDRPPAWWLVEGLGAERRGAHNGGHNTPHVGVAFAGDWRQVPAGTSRTELRQVLAELGAWLALLYGKALPLRPHSDFSATACPGALAGLLG